MISTSERVHGECDSALAFFCELLVRLVQTVVLLQNSPSLRAESRKTLSVGSDHGFGTDHRIHNCFFYGLHDGEEQGVDMVIGLHLGLSDLSVPADWR